MIVKVKVGSSFGGCVRYNLGRDEAEILHAEGVRMDTPQHMTEDFNQVRKLNPDLGKAVWHTSISFAPEDVVTPELMRDIAKDYVDKFGLEQYAVIRHVDQSQQHFHIIGNRVKFNGKTVSDQYNAQRGVELSGRLEKKYGLTEAKAVGKRLDLTHEDKLTGPNKVKYEIFKAVNQELPKCKSLDELRTNLKTHGIETEFKAKEGKVYGIAFAKEGKAFSGSAIDKTLGMKQLTTALESALKTAIPGLSQATQILKLGKNIGRSM